MSFLQNIFASIALFVGSFFGFSHPIPVPVVPVTQIATSTTQQTTSSITIGTFAIRSVKHGVAAWIPYLSLSTEEKKALYIEDKNGVVYFSGSSPESSMGSVNRMLFVPDSEYAKDDMHVYQFGVYTNKSGSWVIPDTDPATLSVLVDADGKPTGRYSIDKLNVYYSTQPIDGADIGTFTADVPKNDSYDAEDKNHHYLRGGIVINPKTAVPLMLNSNASNYFTDTTGTIYFSEGTSGSVAVLKANKATFSIIPDMNGNPTNYAKDKQHVYMLGGLLGSLNPYGPTPLSGVDPTTFSVITDIDFKKELQPSYSKDKNAVYYATCAQWCGAQVVVGADPSTFNVVQGESTGIDAQDKNYTYLNGQVVQ